MLLQYKYNYMLAQARRSLRALLCPGPPKLLRRPWAPGSAQIKRKRVSSEEDKTPCLYCGEPYCDSEEGFVQRGTCLQWSHYSCAGYDSKCMTSFVCEVCE